jgi:hypothetical protein
MILNQEVTLVGGLILTSFFIKNATLILSGKLTDHVPD